MTVAELILILQSVENKGLHVLVKRGESASDITKIFEATSTQRDRVVNREVIDTEDCDHPCFIIEAYPVPK